MRDSLFLAGLSACLPLPGIYGGYHPKERSVQTPQSIHQLIEGCHVLRTVVYEQNALPAFFLVLAGAAGVGKTTLARRLLHRRQQEKQAELLRRLIRVVPGERTPRRRLIRLFLTEGDLAEAERTINATSRELGQDNIVDRYRAILTLRRSELLEGLLEEDRNALRLEAERLALACIRRQPLDRYNYGVLADVGLALAARSGETRALSEVIRLMTEAERDIPDSDFARDRRRLEGQLRRYDVAAAAEQDEATIHMDSGLLDDSEG